MLVMPDRRNWRGDRLIAIPRRVQSLWLPRFRLPAGSPLSTHSPIVSIRPVPQAGGTRSSAILNPAGDDTSTIGSRADDAILALISSQLIMQFQFLSLQSMAQILFHGQLLQDIDMHVAGVHWMLS